jgi:hypothetical protein
MIDVFVKSGKYIIYFSISLFILFYIVQTIIEDQKKKFLEQANKAFNIEFLKGFTTATTTTEPTQKQK